ncbi:putative plant organelle RNA recognition domain-containing protein [Medicago truncatula]|uniref:Plant organelle RNA recognition domain protein n=1 Tax=Medicago truncatula TaxID=3880 RepID=A0A072U8H2_MEDTR|nr:protein WHAT'S THIS FACTOR 9, mitochondrial [Medicago truncatula]KEH26074.1 plant organelle RNA recognition domain protein [Medicago truncatula]RHN51322.1 putative plant organelle RNA recognition domain-containing protein [Medicago truncatula]
MRFTIFSLRHTTPTAHRHHLRTLFSGTFTLVRDRGLDHAVEREKNLKPLLTLLSLINNEPTKSLPISIIKQSRSLNLPFRPIEFIRKYPSVFEEFYNNGCTFEPHVKLTAKAIDLNADEKFLVASDVFKKDVAVRVLKLLMIAKGNKIPLSVVDGLKWDLGLPDDYVKSVIPEFPDHFRVVGVDNNAVLELVCWSKKHSVSFLEKKYGDKAKGQGKELGFPVQFSTGFEMDKKYEKWVKEWNGLRYVSPYENGVNLSGSSEESDKWVVGVLHEILNLLVSKKTEKDNVLMIGEWLGLASRFKRVILQHPGIFYVSSKNRMYTVVLRDGYKRGLLVEDNPAMEFRRRYIHLMNTVKEDSKNDKSEKGKTSSKEGSLKEDEGKVEEEECDENRGEEEEEEEGSGEECSDDEDEDASETVDDDEEEESMGTRKSSANRRGRNNFVEMNSANRRGRNVAETNSSNIRGRNFDNKRGRNFEESNSTNRRGRNFEESNFTNRRGRNFEESNSTNRRGRNFEESNSTNRRGRNFEESNPTNRRGRNFEESNSTNRRDRNFEESNSNNRRGRNFEESNSTNRRGRNFKESNSANRRGRNSVEMKLGTEKPSRDSRRERSGEKLMRSTWEKNASEVSKRMQMRGEHKDVENSPHRSRSTKSREGLLTVKKTVV